MIIVLSCSFVQSELWNVVIYYLTSRLEIVILVHSSKPLIRALF